jgi:hypothetical protein
MNTKLINGVSPGSRDAEVLRALDRLQGSFCGTECRIGIRNEDGTIYRIVVVRGMQEWICCDNALLALNLVNELETSVRNDEGYDSIFSP